VAIAWFTQQHNTKAARLNCFTGHTSKRLPSRSLLFSIIHFSLSWRTATPLSCW